jgi:hypothetical protein
LVVDDRQHVFSDGLYLLAQDDAIVRCGSGRDILRRLDKGDFGRKETELDHQANS